MPLDFEQLSVPEGGEATRFDGEFRPPDVPIVPVAHGAEGAIVRATRRVLDAATDLMGRDVRWLRVYVGGEAIDRYGVALPRDTVRALRYFRLGLVGSLAAARADATGLEAELQRRVGLTLTIDRQSRSRWIPSPLRDAGDVDLTIFRDTAGDAAAGAEYGPETGELRDFLLATVDDPDAVPEGPAAYSVRPVSAAATESLVDAAMEYALDRDRHTLTILHQDDLLPVSEGSFLDWARAHIADEYGDVTIDEATFRGEYDGGYPQDEVVVAERRTDTACRDLLARPGEYDVLAVPGPGGPYVSAVAAAAAGGVGVSPRVLRGEGRLVALSRAARADGAANPIGTILSGCLLFEHIGWEDAAATIRSAVTAALADGVLPRDLYRRRARGTPVTADGFADAVIGRLDAPGREPGSGGIRTTAEERSGIREIITGVYNIVFEDRISPHDVELNQLLGEDEEADVYLPEVGLNFYYWRRWSAERRLEVLLHEFAHVEEEAGERDHGPEFYDRLVELTGIAADWEPELEALFGEALDFDRVRRFVIESVHEETIEPDLESVRDRKRALREQFGRDADEHY